ncbi:hypothetical protein [Nonomuraea sp. NPDC049309]|uniref:hypothetical protein n=1 Tax=Nonomuraea sp. NPDC049309 TaxID=3364350 RepID=UPI0037186201
MKGKLIAAGGALATAVALGAMAAPAEAAIRRCDLGIGDRTQWLSIDPWGVHAGKRKAKACERRRVFHDRFVRDFQAFGDDADELDDAASGDDELDDENFEEADARPHWSAWGHRGFGAARYGNWNGYNWPGPSYGLQ